MFVRQYSFGNASDGEELQSFRLVESRSDLPEGAELVELTSDPQSFGYAGYQFCGCGERHTGLAKGTVKIYVDGKGGPHLDWSGVNDPSFPCENGSSDAQEGDSKE